MNKALLSAASPVAQPNYARAETYDSWIQVNAELVITHWRDFAVASGKDPDRPVYADLIAFAKSEYESCSGSQS